MDLLGRLFIFFPMKKNKKFTNVLTRNISELAALKLVMGQNKFSNIAADTVALTETANKLLSDSHQLNIFN